MINGDQNLMGLQVIQDLDIHIIKLDSLKKKGTYKKAEQDFPDDDCPDLQAGYSFII